MIFLNYVSGRDSRWSSQQPRGPGTAFGCGIQIPALPGLVPMVPGITLLPSLLPMLYGSKLTDCPCLVLFRVLNFSSKGFAALPSTPIPTFNERPPACKNTPKKTSIIPQCSLFGRAEAPYWLRCSFKGGVCLTLLSPYSSQCSSSLAGIKRCKAAECRNCCRSVLKCLDSTGWLRDWDRKRCNRSCSRQIWNDVFGLWTRSCLNFCKQSHEVVLVWSMFPGRTQWTT